VSVFISILDVSLLEYLLAKKELSYDEISSSALSLFGGGVDTVSLYELWALCNLKSKQSMRYASPGGLVSECQACICLSDIHNEISEDTVKMQHSKGLEVPSSVYACVGALLAAT